MAAFWGILATVAAVAFGFAAYMLRVAVLALRREPVWHPGDSLPVVPEDSAISRDRG